MSENNASPYKRDEAGRTVDEFSEIGCHECNNHQNLWICLICGYVGCGRYNQMHAVRHYDHSNHSFSIELSSQRIWNYRGDNYVHRLIKAKINEQSPLPATHLQPDSNQINSSSLQERQSSSSNLADIRHANSSATKSDSHHNKKHTLVMNLPDQINSSQLTPLQDQSSSTQQHSKKYVDDRFLLDKIQTTISEYNFLLASQLEEQRAFFEQKIQEERQRYLNDPMVS